MKISRHELDQLIEEEINEIFGSKKKEALKDYPADEMVGIINTIWQLAAKADVEIEPDDRETIVQELAQALERAGYRLHEQSLVLGDELSIDIDSLPTLSGVIKDIMTALPEAKALIEKAFKRGGITLSISPAPQEVEPDEDQTATIVTEPVSTPDDEDQTDTVVVPPVEPPDDEEEEEPGWVDKLSSALLDDKNLDMVQSGLDVLGAVGLWPPAMVVSKPSTMASFVLNASRGMYGWALFDLVSLVPVAGDAMKAGKLGKAAMATHKTARVKKLTAMRAVADAGQADKLRKGAKAAKGAPAAKKKKKGGEGLAALLSPAFRPVLEKVIDAKTDEGSPLIPWMIEQLNKVPILGDKVKNLQRTWQDVISRAATEEAIPAVAEHKELDRMKALAGIK